MNINDFNILLNFNQREDGAADIADYEDYPVSSGGDGGDGGDGGGDVGRGGREGDDDGDVKERDSNQLFDPHGFEKYFRTLEDGIEDEVQVNIELCLFFWTCKFAIKSMGVKKSAKKVSHTI